MIGYISKYREIIDILIRESFPKLKGKKIYIIERDVPYRSHVSYFPWGFRIILSKKLRKFSQRVVKRILIHELCHLEIFLSWGIIKTNLDYVYYLLSKKHRAEVEKEANVLMIKKGYGKLVLDARKDNLKRGLSYSISEKEIKFFMEQLK